ncbi:pseudouridine synthase [Curtobacterium flaccumfaciens pv. flaccumfaciens]|nr:pseudouridine synthase [Curtobacterium flaccumfaciens pv. flaccumfaciens]MBO9057070.1 pseudouridine synthase [Curtobacterium flaccumfaciens pv. flaccumfaciens]QTR91878.1 pseudouridine synthase [Curtobacterium flaccumfaciens pv. flaccumfaciens]QVG67182.1 pseudouridine synthase [Curtobacterium flaccumfaciens pv. flaccumfaciens]
MAGFDDRGRGAPRDRDDRNGRSGGPDRSGRPAGGRGGAGSSAGGRSGGYGRDDRGGARPPRDDDRRGGYPSRDDRGGDRGGYRGASAPRDDRGGYRGRDDRSGGGDRGGYRGNSAPRDDRGGYRGRDDRGGSAPRDDRGGYRGRDDRGGSAPRDDRGGYRGNSAPRDDRGGYRGRDDRGSSAPRDDRGGYRGNSAPRDDRGGYRGRDDRGAPAPRDDRGGYRGSAPRDDRGGYRGRDDRGSSAPRDDRGGYRGNSAPRDDRGGYRGRDDRGASAPRDDRGGYRGRDDRSGGGDRGGYRGNSAPRDDRGGYRGRDDRGASAPRDDRGGYRGRDDRSSAPRDDRGGYRGRDDRGSSAPRDDRRDDRGRDDRRTPDGQQSRVWHNGRRYVGGTTSVRNSDRTTPKPSGQRDDRGNPAEGTPERPIIEDWDAADGTAPAGAEPSLQAEGERLQKVIAAAGVASRRVAENLIVEGRVTVNGEVVDALGRRVDPEKDAISVDGVPVQIDSSRRYIVLNKPTGVVSSLQDERGRRDLTEFVDRYEERLFNVGRLDAETSGLLVLTNDGDLAHVLAHPSFGVQKTYIAKVHGNVNPAVVQRLTEGVELEDGPIKADKVRLLESSRGESLVEITLHSGRNRIVRRMLEAVDHPVLELVRRSFGPLHLGSLPPGKMRELGTVEVGKLLSTVRDAKPSARDDRDVALDQDDDEYEDESAD